MWTDHAAIGTAHQPLGLFARAFLAVALVISGCSSISQHIEPPPPSLTPTADAKKDARDQAITIALTAARGWGEPNPLATNMRREGQESFAKDLQARGEQVLPAGKGDLWIVDLTGSFTPRRLPPNGGTLKCNRIYVAIEAGTYDVISLGCE
jgi:uncharacterized protein YceK